MDKKVIAAAVLGLITSAFITLEIAKPSNANEASENKSTYEQLSLFGDIFERIREKYVEEVKVKGGPRGGKAGEFVKLMEKKGGGG